MSRKSLIILIVIIVVVAVASVAFAFFGFGSGNLSKYSVVYTTDKGTYFGELSFFPKPHLKNPWVLQTYVDDKNQTQVQILPYSTALWEPADVLFINSASIVSWSRLSKDTDMIKMLDNFSNVKKQILEQRKQAGQQPAGGAATQMPTASSTPED